MAQRWSDIRAAQHRRVRRGKRATRDNNATVDKTAAVPPAARIGCVVCLNRHNKRVTSDETTIVIVNRFAVCPEHIDVPAQPGFDVHALRNNNRRPL